MSDIASVIEQCRSQDPRAVLLELECAVRPAHVVNSSRYTNYAVHCE